MRFAQWLLGLAVMTVCGVGTVWVLMPDEAARLRREYAELEREKVELARAVDRLTGEDRVAEVHVIEQLPPEHPGGRPVTRIEFIELDRDGHPLPARQFTIDDDVIFFDALVIKFDPEHVAAGDKLRGKSLAMFRRIYGEHQNPAEGALVDPTGEVPGRYRGAPEANAYERKLWARFWDYATFPEEAAKEGVRVAHGEAVYVPMREGQVWTLTLQNNGGLSIKLHRPATPKVQDA